MEILKTKVMDETSTETTKEILDFLTILIPYASVVAVFWKMIDAVLKYANDGRDARTKELIANATEPLSNDIRELTVSIGALGEQIKNMKK
jgi:uncharacterized protein YggT (Ycf19 family)